MSGRIEPPTSAAVVNRAASVDDRIRAAAPGLVRLITEVRRSRQALPEPDSGRDAELPRRDDRAEPGVRRVAEEGARAAEPGAQAPVENIPEFYNWNNRPR